MRVLLQVICLLAVGFIASRVDTRTPIFEVATGLGAWYPRSFCMGCKARTPGRNKVAVLLFDQKYFQSKVGGPTTINDEQQAVTVAREEIPTISEGEYTKTLDALAEAGPSAIVFDIIIDTHRHNENEIKSIANTIRNLRERGIPIIVAQAGSGDERVIAPPANAANVCEKWPLSGMQPLAVTCAASVVSPVSWSPPFNEWTDKIHFAALYYPHYVEREQTPGFGCKEPGQPTKVLDPTPAWAAYLLMNNAAAFCPGAHDPVLRRDLFLAWGRGETVCDPSTNNEINTSFWWHLRLAIEALIRISDTGTVCSYLPRFSVSDLGISKDQLRGRVVFIGIEDHADFIDVPQGGQLPGVFQHATALDNLLTAGPEGVLNLHSSSIDLAFIGLTGEDIFIFFTVLIIVKSRILYDWLTRAYGYWLRKFCYLGLQIFLPLSLASLVAYFLDVAPVETFVVLFCLMFADKMVDQLSKYAR